MLKVKINDVEVELEPKPKSKGEGNKYVAKQTVVTLSDGKMYKCYPQFYEVTANAKAVPPIKRTKEERIIDLASKFVTLGFSKEDAVKQAVAAVG